MDAVAAFDALYKMGLAGVGAGVDKVNTGLVDGDGVGGGQYAYVSDANGVVSGVKELEKGAQVEIHMRDGSASAEILNKTKASGGRVICVGTTSCRTLESLVNADGSFEVKSKWTEIFIYPGYTFKAMDGLITNFHLPESTLVMLVSAFAGREHVLHAYEEAVKEKYRFFSFGDAMCIL